MKKVKVALLKAKLFKTHRKVEGKVIVQGFLLQGLN